MGLHRALATIANGLLPLMIKVTVATTVQECLDAPPCTYLYVGPAVSRHRARSWPPRSGACSRSAADLSDLPTEVFDEVLVATNLSTVRTIDFFQSASVGTSTLPTILADYSSLTKVFISGNENEFDTPTDTLVIPEELGAKLDVWEFHAWAGIVYPSTFFNDATRELCGHRIACRALPFSHT